MLPVVTVFMAGITGIPSVKSDKLTANCRAYVLLNTQPFSEDIHVCKRSARFVVSCLQSKISLVRSVARFGVLVNRCVSPLGRNALFCCSNFGWRFDAFVNGE